MSALNRLAFVDVETTGLHPQHHRVIDVGVVLVDNHCVVKEYSSLVDPNTYLPPGITSITGISPYELERSPTFRNISEELYSLLDGRLFIAHNVRFDYSFIRREFSRVGIKFSAPTFCTVTLSRRIFPQYPHHSLDDLITYNHLHCSHRHRALSDAQAIAEFYLKYRHLI